MQAQEPAQIREGILWSAKYQLLPLEALDKMQLLETSGEGCKQVQKYHLELSSGQLTIWWNPVLQLVMLLDREGADVSTTMKLTEIETRGPVVAEFQKLFIATWVAQKGEPPAGPGLYPPPEQAGPDVVRAIGSSPEEPYSLIYATLLSAIGSAETSVYITNAYFAPDPQLLDALEAAARRGVDVRLILPGKTDSWLVFHAGRNYYARLLRAGVKLYERQGVILHAKTASVDGVWSTIGSTNLDWRSFLHNYELNAVVLGTEFGAQLQRLFDADLAASTEVTLAQWRRRSLDVRIKELFARMWEYWL